MCGMVAKTPAPMIMVTFRAVAWSSPKWRCKPPCAVPPSSTASSLAMPPLPLRGKIRNPKHEIPNAETRPDHRCGFAPRAEPLPGLPSVPARPLYHGGERREKKGSLDVYLLHESIRVAGGLRADA